MSREETNKKSNQKGQMTKPSFCRVDRKQIKIFLVVIAAILMVGILIDVSPFGGNIRFYAKWISCGEKPVAQNTELTVGIRIKSYIANPPIYYAYRSQPEYFCTALEAEQAGYSASSERYYFPELEKAR